MGIDLNRFRKNRPSEWVEWLADDPLPPKSQQAAPVQPQVHRPATYSPVQRPAMQIPVQQVANTSVRPMAPPGLAQPIHPVSPVSQTMQPTGAMRPGSGARPMQQPVRPASVVRPPRSVRPYQSVASAPQSPVGQGAASASSAAVSIQISMPKLSMPKLPALPYKRIGYWAGGALVFSGIAIGGWTVYKHFGKNDQVAVKGVSTVHTAPTFDTLAPKDKPQLGEGTDPANSAYDGQRNLYTFKDTLMGFPLVVSQQPLPENVKKNPSELQKVAESMGVNVTSTETAYGKVYVANSEKGDAQRGVFAYKDVLVLVQSYKVFDNDTWKYYVETLR